MFSRYGVSASQLLSRVVLSMVAIALPSLPATAQLFQVTNLVSDIDHAAANPVGDAALVNPWGLAASGRGPWWVSDNGTGMSTLYDGAGTKQGLVVNIPQWDLTPGGNPTGVQFNGSAEFDVTPGNPALFLFATEDGTIQGWNPTVDLHNTKIKVNKFPDAVYKGLALGTAKGASYIYAANFRGGTVDVFDTKFTPHSFGTSAFVDESIPKGYAPFNVANINGNLVVTYALQDAAKHDDVAGLGHGFIRVFDTEGTLLMRLRHVAQLNSPWAVVQAPPTGWGFYSGKLLVGNFGSGAIAVFDLNNHGHFFGVLADGSGLPLRIQGLWGLGFGNGQTSGPTNSLYFAAGIFGEAHGLFGTITPLLIRAPGTIGRDSVR
jgi:uncharacterized protein (TIGR03118 family)